MTRKTWDVGAFVAQRARIKLVDFSSDGWGHINFDDLKGNMSCGPKGDRLLLICLFERDEEIGKKWTQ